MLTLPDLNRLKFFFYVYKSRSLIKASASLNITRSAVSQTLKALEEELQTKLFLRDSKKVIPTESGDLLFRSIEPLFADLLATFHQIETGRKELIGNLRVGAPQDFGSNHLAALIVLFRRDNPAITFELVLATPIRLMEMLGEDKLDVAFVDNGDLHARHFPVSVLTVMKENFIAVCTKEYYQERIKKGLVRFQNLQSLDFIDYFSHGPVTRMWFKNTFGKSPSQLNVVFAAESVRALIVAAQGGLGIAVVPERLIINELSSGRLKAVCDTSRLVNKITLTRRLGRSPSAREKAFVEFCRKKLLAN